MVTVPAELLPASGPVLAPAGPGVVTGVGLVTGRPQAGTPLKRSADPLATFVPGIGTELLPSPQMECIPSGWAAGGPR